MNSNPRTTHKVFTFPRNRVHLAVESVFTFPWKPCSPSRGIRTLVSRRARQEETRRKLLVGAAVLYRVDRDLIDHADLDAWMDEYLTKAGDRALFGLEPKSQR